MKHALLLPLLLIGIWPGKAQAKSLPKKYIVKYKNQKNIQKLNFNPKEIVGTFLVSSSSTKDMGIEFVEEDIVMTKSLMPGDNFGTIDSYFHSQWAHTNFSYGINSQAAWDITTGSTSVVVVAIIDSGIVSHSDLNDKVVSGYDFISNPTMANDGDGRDSDPSDPGDYVESGDACHQGGFEPSSWHGTHVAGIVAAKSSNGRGIAGTSWGARIQPIRVLGKCGGYSSDIADAIVWAAGGNVTGVPTNLNPARVINLSLGGHGSCGQYLQSAIDTANSLGSVVVVATGNSGINLDYNEISPANCNGVIRVGSHDSNGVLSNFSNYGSKIDITAPGENIYSTIDGGYKVPSYESYKSYSGTSMATPFVSGALALMIGQNPSLHVNQYKSILKESAKSVINCYGRDCGSGALDIERALEITMSAVYDPNVTDETFIERAPLSEEAQTVTSSKGGGFCGSVNFTSEDNSKGSLVLMILLMLTIHLLNRFRLQKAEVEIE